MKLIPCKIVHPNHSKSTQNSDPAVTQSKQEKPKFFAKLDKTQSHSSNPIKSTPIQVNLTKLKLKINHKSTIPTTLIKNKKIKF
jgi:hypothetical protein